MSNHFHSTTPTNTPTRPRKRREIERTGSGMNVFAPIAINIVSIANQMMRINPVENMIDAVIWLDLLLDS
jgi:hypothetical protein